MLCFCELQPHELEAGQRKLKPLNPSNLATPSKLAFASASNQQGSASCHAACRPSLASQMRVRGTNSCQTFLSWTLSSKSRLCTNIANFRRVRHLTCSPRKVVGLTLRVRATRVSERCARAENSCWPVLARL